MKKPVSTIIPLIVFLSLTSSGTGQGNGASGVRGERVTPITISVRNLPTVSVPPVGAVIHIPRGDVPEGAKAFEEWKRNQPPVHVRDNVTIDPSATQTPSALALTVSSGFEGITQQGYIPGEPQPAVGPNHILVIGNVSIVIRNKNDTVRTEVLQTDFLGIGTSEGPGFDGKCFYDAQRGRFVILTETQGKQGNTKWSNYYLAISKTSDARGNWQVYKFDMTKDGTTQTSNWSDFPGLGVSDDKIVMSGQQYSFGGNQYQYQKLRVISRDSAYAGSAVTYIDFFGFSAPPGGTVSDLFVTKPGRNVSPDATIHLFTVRYAGGSNVAYRTITGPPNAPVLSAGAVITVNPYGVAVNAKQLGTTNQLDGGDCRTPDFFVRNGILHIAWHFGNDFGSGAVDAVRYLKLRTSDLTVLTDETFGADGIYYYYPMVCVDSVGTMFMGFCRSSSSEYSSSWVTGKRRTEASIQASTLAKAGVVGNTQSRWGDFTGIDMDESATSTGGAAAWYSGLWAKESNRFGTWVNQMTLTYGKISGRVLLDSDGDSTTIGDRSGLSGWTVTLKQGSTTIATMLSDNSGNYNFGYLETGVYNVILTLQAGYNAMTTLPGSGGTSQTKIDNLTLEVNVTNAQVSTGNIFLVSQKAFVSVKVFLQGPYNTSTGLMNKDLKDTGVLLPHFSGVQIPANAVDSITVEIRNSASAAGSTILKQKPAWLLTDGTVRDYSDTTKSYVRFDSVGGSYYIVVRHRNHLPIESASAVTLASTPPAFPYDFAASQTQAYGTGGMVQIASGPEKWAMWAGDVTGNGMIKYSGAGNDRAPILIRIGGTDITATVSGYYNEDANLNGVVKYSGPGNDRAIILVNIGGTDITGSKISQVP